LFSEVFNVVAGVAKKKLSFLSQNPLGYFIASMLAGVYVGFGIILIYSIGGQLMGLHAVKMVMGISFGIALSLVIMAGAELFTGNNLIMMAGCFAGIVKIGDVIKLLVVCYLGNWLGAILIALAFYGTGFLVGGTREFIAVTSAMKMSTPFFQLIFRGLMCNILVCVCTWCSYKLKSESGKLIIIFWCLFAFITSGYEHCIANMTLLTLSLLAPFSTDVGLGGYFYNILVVSLGNMIGGICFIALPYFLISRKNIE